MKNLTSLSQNIPSIQTEEETEEREERAERAEREEGEEREERERERHGWTTSRHSVIPGLSSANHKLGIRPFNADDGGAKPQQIIKLVFGHSKLRIQKV